ncbi:NAD(P)/FAD-dependent oxidoreductase [Aquimarina sp. W85]|uniref:NAD(P)/FAD-dependent oxidoreductase n=1 Tax=Aquimarina rhodophyticola TaxID=3342246 RepID=UPI0036735DE7
MLDYIIVGFGLSGLAFAEQLVEEGKTFVVYENYSQRSSRVAGGLFNPVVLKRFTLAWDAFEHMKTAIPYYRKLEDKLHFKIVYDLPILRRFTTIEEQNQWFEACDKPILSAFMSPNLVKNTNSSLQVPFQYGCVRQTGRIAINQLLETYLADLENKALLHQESFDHTALEINEFGVSYKTMKAKHVVFAEGFGVHDNPFFNHLPILGNKGEYLIIESEELKLNLAVKAAIFIIPLGNNLYKVGATYNAMDKTSNITLASRKEIEKKLAIFVRCKYKVIDQVAGIRPTVKDRKPIIGTHPVYPSLHILNGLGSRGILTSPSVARSLYRAIEYKDQIDPLLSLERFN